MELVLQSGGLPAGRIGRRDDDGIHGAPGGWVVGWNVVGNGAESP
jgi:hypothetical protein